MSLGQYDQTDFSEINSISANEVPTRARVRDITLSSGRVLALITLCSEQPGRPNTLWAASLTELKHVLDELKGRATAGEIHAVGIIGSGRAFSAGADLSMMPAIASRDAAMQLAQLGHHALGRLSDLGVPSFGFINGTALGGGLEIALHTSYRTIHPSAVLGLPEVGIGLLPGWGGTFLLPNLIGVDAAIKIMVSDALKNRGTVAAAQAVELGIVDALFPASNFLEDSLKWADSILTGSSSVIRDQQPNADVRGTLWTEAVEAERCRLARKVGIVPKAPYAALELIEKAKDGDRKAAFEREDQAFAELILGEQFEASLYAFNTVQKLSKRPSGAPDSASARKVTKVGIIGAGLMARQFALLFATRLRVPVLLNDLDEFRVTEAVSRIHEEIGGLEAKGRLDHDTANRIRSLILASTDLADYADCDFVIEAVFEETRIKQKALASIEPIISAEAVLATNTSSLSVEEIGTALENPERLVGFHFFNPVAAMPLLEIVSTPMTNQETLATAFATAKALGKTAVLTADVPGFVVNRILAKVMGEAAHAIEQGTSLETVERAFASLLLPMSPIELIDLVGWKVAAHVQDTMHDAFPDRFFASENFHRLASIQGDVLERDENGRVVGWTHAAQEVLETGVAPIGMTDLLHRIQDGLANEARIMLSERVVSNVEDLDLCLLLGAGWPYINGGLTPYLDRVGASRRSFGATFHEGKHVAAPIL
ncbi:3-hydroxyacyl-CoA dehydrogenase NAD-binding domain-containing protein [Arthrobacter bambusae]|uniref:3-hydroxyacyl-CoA dehydrogenase NAD-binding domain-containing protein n=1 Tax=Arthrobacter bambusae TaxID=1338426 RepID=UPI001F5146A2|nr:3-hydroxyacyl-CoA dehydrogenase NAD-binding domain-containing protein [Arthrobacter bambusae]